MVIGEAALPVVPDLIRRLIFEHYKQNVASHSAAQKPDFVGSPVPCPRARLNTGPRFDIKHQILNIRTPLGFREAEIIV